jgi:hypothetical protein
LWEDATQQFLLKNEKHSKTCRDRKVGGVV